MSIHAFCFSEQRAGFVCKKAPAFRPYLPTLAHTAGLERLGRSRQRRSCRLSAARLRHVPRHVLVSVQTFVIYYTLFSHSGHRLT